MLNQKNPENREQILYSTAFTPSQTNPKQRHINKQAIMHSCPRIFLKRASVKEQNYRTWKLHYRPQKKGTDWEIN